VDQATPVDAEQDVAATIHAQLGATAISSGTGSASAQPAMSRRRRPEARGRRAGREVGQRLGQPEGDDETRAPRRWTRRRSRCGDERQRRALRAHHRPTNALIATSSENCASSRATRAGSSAARSRLSVRRRLANRRDRRGWPRRSPLVGRRRRDVAHQGVDEGVLGVELQGRLWRRSKPIVEIGLADRPRPQTEPE